MAKKGAFGRTWWAEKWIEALEILGRDYSNRLPRGRTYARRGAVRDLIILPGEVRAKVQGTRRTPYQVRIKLPALTNKQWQNVITALAKQAIFAAKLLVGEMPSTIDEAFNGCGLSLFPVKATELKTSCSCPDWANPCKHIAATHYILGQSFDSDPFLLFELRGRTKEKLMEELREARSAHGCVETKSLPQEEKEPAEQLLPDTLNEEEFVSLGASLEDLHFHISQPQGKSTTLSRLGPLSGIAGGHLFTVQLEQIYSYVSFLAQEIALASPKKRKRGSDLDI
ncbi:SWIM zinc finger family protein [Candidatus Aerophobetes bacterium]|nr:SWIM zinc finger family protein [Candidatus Aerophobetes bacterium]